MTFSNENPINNINENKNEKIFSLRDVPPEIIEKADKKLIEITKNENPKLEAYGNYGKIIKMMSRASVYNNNFGPARA